MRTVILWKIKDETLNGKPIPSLLFFSFLPSYYEITTALKKNLGIKHNSISICNESAECQIENQYSYTI